MDHRAGVKPAPNEGETPGDTGCVTIVFSPEATDLKGEGMDYFQLLNLSREPFSNSPDPEFFYPSPEHVRCLQKLELAIRLRRGLNVVVGAIGTGKTTLCRHIIREFSADKAMETHLILDPDFNTPEELLYALADMFGLTVHLQDENSRWQVRESIKQHLFQKGMEEEKTLVLIIDEGQKIPPFCLEILRELLNYETNEHKLLQIIIFAQEEFRTTLAEHPSFADRINFFHILAPLSFQETRNLLQFRLNQAKDGYKEPRLFTTPGLWAIYRATKGYPRKIVHLSHRVLLTMIIQNRPTAGWFLVRWCARMMLPPRPLPIPWLPAAIGLSLVALVLLGVFAPAHIRLPFFTQSGSMTSSPTRQALPVAEPPTPRRARIPDPAAMPDLPPPEAEPAVSASGAPQNGTAALIQETALKPSEETLTPEAQPGEELRGEQPAPAPEPEPPPAVSQEPIPEASSQAPPVAFHPPEVLGQVTTRPGDTLERMIRRVYGLFDQSYLKAVIQLNPQITDFNALEVGKAIKFPPLPVRADPLPKGGCYVQVSQANSLNEAFKLLRSYPVDAPQVFLLPHWNPRDGLKFGLVLKDCCPDQQIAESTLGALPASLATHARIIGKEDEQAVFLVK
jgi:general secretion pathway protein A